MRLDAAESCQSCSCFVRGDVAAWRECAAPAAAAAPRAGPACQMCPDLLFPLSSKFTFYLSLSLESFKHCIESVIYSENVLVFMHPP